MHGPEVLARFDAVRSELDGQIATLAQAQQEATARLDALARERVQLHARIARVRLQALDQDALVHGLQESDRQALELLRQRDQALALLEQELAGNRVATAALEQRRGEQLQESEAAQQDWDARHAAILAQLQHEPGWDAMLERAAALEHQVERVRARLQQAQADRDEKRRGFEADPLFMYLWQAAAQRRRARGLFAALDRWVARLCQFPRNARNYAALLALPDRLVEHAGRIEEQLAQVVQEGRRIEEQAIARDGAGPLRARAARARAQLEGTDEALQQAHASQQRLDEERNALLGPDNRYQHEAEQLLQAAFAAIDAAALQRMAAATASPEDDFAARRLQEVERAHQEAAAELAAQHQQHAELAARRKRIEQARATLRRKHYDRGDARFDKGLDAGELLTGYLLGSLSHGDLFRRLDRAHTWSGSRGGSTGGIRRSRSGGSRSGGGGFRGGGGFGGGGFRSGGGF